MVFSNLPLWEICFSIIVFLVSYFLEIERMRNMRIKNVLTCCFHANGDHVIHSVDQSRGQEDYPFLFTFLQLTFLQTRKYIHS